MKTLIKILFLPVLALLVILSTPLRRKADKFYPNDEEDWFNP